MMPAPKPSVVPISKAAAILKAVVKAVVVPAVVVAAVCAAHKTPPTPPTPPVPPVKVGHGLLDHDKDHKKGFRTDFRTSFKPHRDCYYGDYDYDGYDDYR